jgi:centrosomal protein CEP290
MEQNENKLQLEVSRLRELAEITLYQVQSMDFINHLSKAHSDLFALIDAQTLTSDETTLSLGKLHRQMILMQLSEATAVRKLHQSEAKCKRLETDLVRAEQKYDKENLDFFLVKKEYVSKITYLRSTVQDLRHKYTGAIPLRQQERFNQAKEQLSEIKKELNEKLLRVKEEKYELEDQLAEYNLRIAEIEVLKKAATVGKDGVVKFNEKFLDSFKKNENIKMLNLKLDRANRRHKDEVGLNLNFINKNHGNPNKKIFLAITRGI